jgi:transposase
MSSAKADIPHPDYGLDHATRLLVLQDAEIMGVRSAALIHNVGIASIYVWRKRYDFTAHHETKRKEN